MKTREPKQQINAFECAYILNLSAQLFVSYLNIFVVVILMAMHYLRHITVSYDVFNSEANLFSFKSSMHNYFIHLDL